MKEFEPHKKVGTEQIQKVKQEYKLIGSHKKKRGMKAWCYNVATDDLQEVDTKKQIAMTGLVDSLGVKETHKAQYNPDCVYFNAINYKNAVKKAVKIMSRMIDIYKMAHNSPN